MKTLLALTFLLGSLALSGAATTINSTNKFTYGANVGWMDWRGDTNSGAVIGEFVCSGYIYSANVGWIHLGSNAPVNGIQYQNNSATDYGVNHDGLGNLRGSAWSANIGWVNFETNGAPKVNLVTGKLSGFIYSANCGWISLSNAFAVVQTDHIQTGVDSDVDGIADAWERTYTNTLSAFTATSDTDHDGVSDKNEYFADTSPLDPNSVLRITSHSVAVITGTESDTLTWNSRPTRQYVIQSRTSLDSTNAFTDATSLLSPDAGTTTTRVAAFGVLSPQRFFRLQATKPLP